MSNNKINVLATTLAPEIMVMGVVEVEVWGGYVMVVLCWGCSLFTRETDYCERGINLQAQMHVQMSQVIQIMLHQSCPFIHFVTLLLLKV